MYIFTYIPPKGRIDANEDAMDAAFGGAREDSVLEACMMTAYQNIKEQMNYIHGYWMA